MNKISLIIPVYNEAESLEKLHASLSSVIDSQKKYSFEILFVEDGSKDASFEIIQKLAKKDSRIRYARMSRNFGKEAALSAGLKMVRGDAAIFIDGDGQYPATKIPEFLKSWEAGNEVVIGVRLANQNEGFVKKYGSKVFYRILNTISGERTIPGSTDFRLIDRKVIDSFNEFSERGRITRGLIDWLGYRRDVIYFTALPREFGVATYNFRKLFKLAMDAFVSQSTKPLKFTGILGFIVTVFSLVMAAFVVVESFILNDPLKLNFTGTGLLGIFVSFLVGIVLVCQGLLALYIESIHTETQNRPLYVIAEKSDK